MYLDAKDKFNSINFNIINNMSKFEYEIAFIEEYNNYCLLKEIIKENIFQNFENSSE